VIVGQDANGRPVADASCTGCHTGAGAPDVFTPWAQTGHAEIFSDMLDTNTHYARAVRLPHRRLQPRAGNGGFDDAPDYQAFLNAGLINNPGDNWTTMLAQFPAPPARQHSVRELPRSADEPGPHPGRAAAESVLNVCATCHGEPAATALPAVAAQRARQLRAGGRGRPERNCSKCHTANGFLAWLPILDGTVPGDPADSVEVTWTRTRPPPDLPGLPRPAQHRHGVG